MKYVNSSLIIWLETKFKSVLELLEYDNWEIHQLSETKISTLTKFFSFQDLETLSDPFY